MPFVILPSTVTTAFDSKRSFGPRCVSYDSTWSIEHFLEMGIDQAQQVEPCLATVSSRKRVVTREAESDRPFVLRKLIRREVQAKLSFRADRFTTRPVFAVRVRKPGNTAAHTHERVPAPFEQRHLRLERICRGPIRWLVLIGKH